jgi:hypothetical protein
MSPAKACGIPWESPLCVVNDDFIAIEKPFTHAIRVAINAYEAAAVRHPEDLDNRPGLAHEIRKQRPAARPYANPIPAIQVARLWLRYCYTHGVPPFVLPNSIGMTLLS